MGRPSAVDNKPYRTFKEHGGEFTVIFTAVKKLLTGEWVKLRSGTLSEAYQVLEFNIAGTLYRNGFPVRILALDEYRAYSLLSVSGYALVDRYLQQ